MMANFASSSKSVEVNLSGIERTYSSLTNEITRKTVGTVNNNKIQISLAAYEAMLIPLTPRSGATAQHGKKDSKTGFAAQSTRPSRAIIGSGAVKQNWGTAVLYDCRGRILNRGNGSGADRISPSRVIIVGRESLQ
mgnify:CR=1 FL=1